MTSPAQSLVAEQKRTFQLSQGGLGLSMRIQVLGCQPTAFWSSWADSLPVPPHPTSLSTQHKSWNTSNTLQQLSPASKQQQLQPKRLKSVDGHLPTWTELTQGIQPNTTEANHRRSTQNSRMATASNNPRSTRPCTMNSKPPSLQPARPCYNPKLAPSQAEPSPLYPIPSSSTLPTSSGSSSSSIVSVCTSHSLHVLVGAVALLTPLATTAQHVLSQESAEGGARVTTNTRLADLNIQNLSDRRIEVIANGLPMWGGSQLAVDTTLVSPLTRSGEQRSRGGTYAGAALQDARTKKKTYPELLQNRRCRLVVLGIEVGGRWSNEASNFIRMLANARAPSSPPSLQAAARAALVSRWSALLSRSDVAAELGRRSPSPHPLAHASPCSGRSGFIPSLLQAHLETGQYKNSLCLEAAQ